jgi:hypothetical protein
MILVTGGTGLVTHLLLYLIESQQSIGSESMGYLSLDFMKPRKNKVSI